MQKDFSQAQKYLLSLIPKGDYVFPGEIGLKRMQALLEELDNPQSHYITVHIAGTSGKGSTCYMIAKILESAGYKTGLTVSPHIVSIHERMQINSTMISDEEFARIVFDLKPTFEKVSKGKYGEVSYFEAQIAIIFEYFKRQNVDIVVVETGLGGTYDATNVLNSIISVITPIGYDHTDILGETLTEIAGNKAGIIKDSNRVVVSGLQEEEAEEVLRNRAQQMGVVCVMEDENFQITVNLQSEEGIDFNYTNDYYNTVFNNLECKLLGAHQAHNAALAITACLELRDVGYEIDEKAIRKALKEVRIPGRLEIIKKNDKTYILDGAHNEEKVKALANALQNIWPQKKFTTIFASKKDKDVDKEAEILIPYIEKLIATRYTIMMHAGKYSALEPQTIAEAFKSAGYKGEVEVFENPKEAVDKVSDDVVLVTGSLYLVSEIRNMLC